MGGNILHVPPICDIIYVYWSFTGGGAVTNRCTPSTAQPNSIDQIYSKLKRREENQTSRSFPGAFHFPTRQARFPRDGGVKCRHVSYILHHLFPIPKIERGNFVGVLEGRSNQHRMFGGKPYGLCLRLP